MTDKFPPFYTYDATTATAPQRRNFVMAALQQHSDDIEAGRTPPIQVLVLEEVAAYLRVSVSTVRFWIREGKLRSARPGRRRIVHVHDLKAFLSPHERIRDRIANADQLKCTPTPAGMLIEVGARVTASTLHVELEREEGWALALLLKRITYSDVRGCAQDDGEAKIMLNAIQRLQNGLADIGIAPR